MFFCVSVTRHCMELHEFYKWPQIAWTRKPRLTMRWTLESLIVQTCDGWKSQNFMLRCYFSWDRHRSLKVAISGNVNFEHHIKPLQTIRRLWWASGNWVELVCGRRSIPEGAPLSQFSPSLMLEKLKAVNLLPLCRNRTRNLISAPDFSVCIAANVLLSHRARSSNGSNSDVLVYSEGVSGGGSQPTVTVSQSATCFIENPNFRAYCIMASRLEQLNV